MKGKIGAEEANYALWDRDESASRDDVIAIFHSERGTRRVEGFLGIAKHLGRSIKRSFAETGSGSSRGSVFCGNAERKRGKSNWSRRPGGEGESGTDKTTLYDRADTYLRYWRNMAQKAVSSDTGG